MKYECEKAVTDSAIKARTDYADAVASWNGEMEQLRAKRAEHIKKLVRKYGNMKIVIPPSLEGIYDEVSHLGKDDNNGKGGDSRV